MMRVTALWSLLLALSSVAISQSLLEALVQAGASEFAAKIEADPETLAFFNTFVKTIFAPKDACDLDDNYRFVKRVMDPTVAIQGSIDDNLVATATENARRSLETGISPFEVETVDDTSNLGPDTNTTVVVEYEEADEDYYGWMGRLFARSGEEQCNDLTASVKTGLGDAVLILEANIPFDNGLIHLVESYFTQPELLSTTAELNEYTEFLDLLCSTGQLECLDNIPRTTFFIPSDEALEAACLSDEEKEQVLAEHVFPDFLGYTPTLLEGVCFTNQNGNTYTVTVQDGEIFVGDAKIIETNVIIDNGVAHVIDKVLTPPVYIPEEVSTSTYSSVKTSTTASW